MGRGPAPGGRRRVELLVTLLLSAFVILASVVVQASLDSTAASTPATSTPLQWAPPKLVDRQAPYETSPPLLVTWTARRRPSAWPSPSSRVMSSRRPTRPEVRGPGRPRTWTARPHLPPSRVPRPRSAWRSTGRAMSSRRPTRRAVPARGRSQTWTVRTGSSGISCPSTSRCVAVDRSGDVVTSDDPTGGPTVWSATDIDPGNRPPPASHARRRRSAWRPMPRGTCSRRPIPWAAPHRGQ